MKRLARLLLTITIRLWLFLTILAWGLSQWRQMLVAAPLGIASGSVVCVPVGYMVTITPKPAEFYVDLNFETRKKIVDWAFDFPGSKSPYSSMENPIVNWPGLHVFHKPEFVSVVSIRHEIMVLLLVVLNLILLTLNRRRSKDTDQ